MTIENRHDTSVMPEATIDYTNYRGERRKRRICPLDVAYRTSQWHGDAPVWLLVAYDVEKQDLRDSMTDIHAFYNASNE